MMLLASYNNSREREEGRERERERKTEKTYCKKYLRQLYHFIYGLFFLYLNPLLITAVRIQTDILFGVCDSCRKKKEEETNELAQRYIDRRNICNVIV